MANNSPAMPDMKDYQAESDLRCLIDAEKIKKDKARYAAAMAKHKEMRASLDAIDKPMKNDKAGNK